MYWVISSSEILFSQTDSINRVHLGFWSGNLFLIAPFPDLCLLVPFSSLNMSEGAMLVELIGDHELEQVVHFPTR